MRTIETTLYTYDELPTDESRERAREWYRGTDAVPGDNWHEFCFDDAKAIGAILGFTIDRIYFSGFYSQGDGASFTGSYYYSPGWKKKLKAYAPLELRVRAIGEALQSIQKPRAYKLQAMIGVMGRYCHEGTMTVSAETADGREVSADEDAAILECARDFARWIYSRLEAEHEYLTSDEAVIESIRATGCEFTESGRPA